MPVSVRARDQTPLTPGQVYVAVKALADVCRECSDSLSRELIEKSKKVPEVREVIDQIHFPDSDNVGVEKIQTGSLGPIDFLGLQMTEAFEPKQIPLEVRADYVAAIRCRMMIQQLDLFPKLTKKLKNKARLRKQLEAWEKELHEAIGEHLTPGALPIPKERGA